MRKKLMAVIAAIIAVCGIVAVTTTFKPAKADQLINLCWNNHCLNNWSGIAADGNAVRYYGYNSGTIANNKWAQDWRGFVNGSNCSSNCWPFLPGSGMNSRYNGYSVYRYPWGPNGNYCLDQLSYAAGQLAGQLRIRACDTDASQEFVYTGGKYLVPVYASDSQYVHDGNANNLPVFVGNSGGNVSDGANVILNPITYTQFFVQQAF